jgi:MFS family permease
MLSSLRRTYLEFPRPFWLLITASFIDLTGGFLIMPFFSLFLTEKFEISLVQVAGIFAIWSIAGMFGQTLGGAVSDRYGRRFMIIVGLVFSAITSLGFALIDELAWALVVAAIAGLFSSSGGPARLAMIADILPKNQYSEGYGIMRVVANVAFAVGPAIGGILAGVSYALLFSIDALTSILAALFVWRFLPESIPESSLSKTSQQSFSRVMRGYLTVLKDRRLLIILGLGTLVSMVYQQWYFALPVFMRDVHQMPPYFYGGMMSMAGIIVIFFQLPIMRHLKPFSVMPVMAASVFIFAIGFTLYGFVGAFSMFLLAGAIVTLGEMIFFPTRQALIAQLAVEEYRGRYMAVTTFAYTLPSIIGPAAGGLIMERTPAYGLWVVAGLVLVISGLAFLFFRSHFEDIQVGGE